MKKIIFSTVIAVILSFSAMQPFTYAETISAVNLVEPYYDNRAQTTTSLSIQVSTATCNSYIQAEDAVKITAEQYLQKQGFLWVWSTYDSAEWTKTVYSDTLSISNTKSGLDSGKYRLKTIFTLTDKNGKTETITVYSDEKPVG